MSDILFSIALAVCAVLYSAVGQAGGTGYVALMGLAGFDPAIIKPTALALNVLVSAIGCIHFHRAGLLGWRTCYPFAILGLPFSMLGGATHLSAAIYTPFVGLLLLVAGLQMLASIRRSASSGKAVPDRPPFAGSLALGGAIGFISRITGVGGGIFLTPLILMLRWAEMRQSAAIATVFNLTNSGAALVGIWATMPGLPGNLPFWLAWVGVGAIIGGWVGARLLSPPMLRGLLAILLLVAAARMLFFPS